jgi:hypothetical protein
MDLTIRNGAGLMRTSVDLVRHDRRLLYRASAR